MELKELYNPSVVKVCREKKLLVVQCGSQGVRSLIFSYGRYEGGLLQLIAFDGIDAREYEIKYYFCWVKDDYKSTAKRIEYPTWDALKEYHKVDEAEYRLAWEQLTGGGSLLELDE